MVYVVVSRYHIADLDAKIWSEAHTREVSVDAVYASREDAYAYIKELADTAVKTLGCPVSESENMLTCYFDDDVAKCKRMYHWEIVAKYVR